MSRPEYRRLLACRVRRCRADARRCGLGPRQLTMALRAYIYQELRQLN